MLALGVVRSRTEVSTPSPLNHVTHHGLTAGLTDIDSAGKQRPLVMISLLFSSGMPVVNLDKDMLTMGRS